MVLISSLSSLLYYIVPSIVDGFNSLPQRILHWIHKGYTYSLSLCFSEAATTLVIFLFLGIIYPSAIVKTIYGHYNFALASNWILQEEEEDMIKNVCQLVATRYHILFCKRLWLPFDKHRELWKNVGCACWALIEILDKRSSSSLNRQIGFSMIKRNMSTCGIAAVEAAELNIMMINLSWGDLLRQ